MKIDFSNSKEYYSVIFQMESLQILPDETDRIFEQGVSGALARKTAKSGDGLGMTIVKRFIEMNGAKIVVKPRLERTSTFANLSYAANQFEIQFPLRNIRTDRQ